MASRFVWLMISLQVVCGNEKVARDGLIDHLSNGMKFAKDFLGKSAGNLISGKTIKTCNCTYDRATGS